MADAAVRIRRVLAALDPCEAEPADLEALARLARGLNAELVGLFLEDASLVAAADLPVTYVLSAGGEGRMAVDSAAMRRALRIAAGEARERLAAAAARWEVKWSFEVAPTAEARQALARLGAEDLVAVAASRTRRSAPARRASALYVEKSACAVMVLRREGQPRQPLAVVYEGETAVLDVARDLARIYERPLLVLIAPSRGADAEAAQGRVAAWLRQAGVSGRVHTLGSGAEAEIIGCLRAVSASIVVLDRRGAAAGRIDPDKLADETQASVMVLGAR